MYCENRGNKSTSTSTVLSSSSSLDNMVIATTWFHCRTLQRLAPPNVSGSAWNGCAWKSASTGTSRVLMQISLQPSSGFNMLQPISGTSHEIFIPGRDEKNMKKQESVSKPATAVFNGAQLWKRKQSRASALNFYQRRRHKFLEGPGTKETRVWYEEQLHQTRTMFDSLLGVQPHLISRVYML